MSTAVREPKIHTDGGPWAEHDQACAVCRKAPAVLELDGWHFKPCWQCQGEGWRLMGPQKGWRRWLSLLLS